MKERQHKYRYIYAAAASGTLFAHPFKLATADAIRTKNPLVILKNVFMHPTRALSYNLLRGGLTTGMQASSKMKVYAELVEHHPRAAIALSYAVGTTLAAFFALFLETPFLRATTGLEDWTKLFKFSRPLLNAYLKRELSFLFAILSSKEVPEKWEWPVFTSGVVVTTMTQRIITWEAMNDLPIGKNFPNIGRDGYVATLKNIARGGVYEDPTLSVLFEKPTKRHQFALNTLFIFCHPTMLLFRGSQMYVMREVYNLTLTLLESDNEMEEAWGLEQSDEMAAGGWSKVRR